MSLNQFLIDTLETAVSNGIKVTFTADPKSKLGGYFDEETLNVNLVTKENTLKERHLWLSTLVHETCHMDQFLEQTELWTDTLVNGVSIWTFVDSWLSHDIELTKEQIETYINIMIGVELDCEIRSIAKIKKYKLPIDLKRYTREANAYMYFHESMKKKRSWMIPGSLYVPEIVNMCPATIQSSFKNTKIINKINKLCYEK